MDGQVDDDLLRSILTETKVIALVGASAKPERVRKTRGERAERGTRGKAAPPAVAELDAAAQARFAALKAWRGEVAREHNLPAYVIFHDATLAAIAARAPQSTVDLQGVSGIGATKLERYGDEVLRVCTSVSG